jgi:cell division protein FtsB
MATLIVVQKSLAAVTDSLQAAQSAHRAEIASLEARKDSEVLAVKVTAVKRVKHLMQEIEGMKANGGTAPAAPAEGAFTGCQAVSWQGCGAAISARPAPACLKVSRLSPVL